VFTTTPARRVQAARENKNDAERKRLLTQAADFLARASRIGAVDPMVHFNYGYALFLQGKYNGSRRTLSSGDYRRPARRTGVFPVCQVARERRANRSSDCGRRSGPPLFANRVCAWETEWQKSQTTSGVNVRMRDVLNREEVFDLNRDKIAANAETPSSATQDLLIKARDLYQAGRDDEALPELHRVVMIEPTNAEAYLLSGRINLRRSDQEAAIAALEDGDLLGSETDRRLHSVGSNLSRTRRPRRSS
jgi:tetratricopeptide (TPR) repeat protein